MSDNDIRDVLRNALEAVHKKDPADFDEVWRAAEQRHQRSRRRYATFSGIAAALAMIMVVAGLWSSRQAGINDEYFIADSLLNSTQWSAPSDTLMPQYQIDIYQEIPFPMESTDLYEGTLL